MSIDRRDLGNLAEGLGTQLSRRRVLRGVAVATAGIAAMAVGGSKASANPPGPSNIAFDPKIASLAIEMCGIYCYPVSCNSQCANPPYVHLVRCEDSCTGQYWHTCATLCGGCLSQAC